LDEGLIVADVAIGFDAILQLADRWPKMRDLLETRLVALRREYNLGQLRIHEVEQQLVNLKETLLRISGAIAVIQEVLSAPLTAGDQKPGLDGTQEITGVADGFQSHDIKNPVLEEDAAANMRIAG
jgi:hypothetical protein